jgi:hypothetical protein
MIGDAVLILNAVRSRKNLRRAYCYALWDRPRDYFYDPFELEHAVANETRILREIAHELRHPEDFKPRPAYAFFPPKTALCYRRMVYLPFKDLVVRYAFLIVVAGLLDRDLSPRCLANRSWGI